MTDWHMVVETFPNGRHNFPKVMPERKSPRGPSRFTTTVRSVHAARGQFTYQDHGTPWSTVGRNLDVTLYQERRQQRLSRQRVVLERHHQHPELRALQRVHAFALQARRRQGDLRSHRPDQRRVRPRSSMAWSIWGAGRSRSTASSRTSTSRRRRTSSSTAIASRAYGQGDFQGTFHLFKGGRELKGTFTSPLAGVNDWRFPNLRGAVLWLPDRLEITDSTSGLYGGTARFDYRMAPIGKKGVPTIATWDVQYRDVDLSRLTRLSRDARPASRRPRDRHQPPRLAARRVGGEAGRRRRGHHAAAWRRDHDAGDARGAAAG